MGAQSASVIMMVRPVYPARFTFNPQTADNYFTDNSQSLCAPGAETAAGRDAKIQDLHHAAMAEFEGVKKMYEDAGIHVVVLENPDPDAPDSIFPNCTVTFPGKYKGQKDYMTLHSMKAPNRRREHSKEYIYFMSRIAGYKVRATFIPYEKTNQALEATAAMVHVRQPQTDRGHHYEGMFFSARSERTDDALIEKYAKKMNYRPIVFNTCDREGKPVYHTDVVMNVGTDFVVICDNVIVEKDRGRVLQELAQTGREVIPITLSQMEHFCGNALEVQNKKSERFLAMSDRAYDALTEGQKTRIRAHVKDIIHAPVSTTELEGGGSVRCLTQELFVRDVDEFIKRLKSYSPNLVFRLDKTIFDLTSSSG